MSPLPDVQDLFVPKQKWSIMLEVNQIVGPGCFHTGPIHVSGFDAIVGTVVASAPFSFQLRWFTIADPFQTTYGFSLPLQEREFHKIHIGIKTPVISFAFNPTVATAIRSALYLVPIRAVSEESDFLPQG